MSLFDDQFSPNNRIIRLQWRTEYQCGYRIMQRASIIQRAQVDSKEIGAFARLEGTEVGPPQDGRSPTRGNLSGRAGSHQRRSFFARVRGATYASSQPGD